MPSSQLKRADRAIAAIGAQSELPPEAAEALEEIVAAVRAVEARLADLERKSHSPTDQMALPRAG